MKDVLIATIHQLKFRALKLNDRDRLAVLDLQDDNFWKAIYTLLRAVYPGLRNLRMADGNKPAMDQSYYPIYKSIDLLNDKDLFDSTSDGDYLVQEDEEIFGDNGDSENEVEMEVDDSEDENEDEDDDE